MADVPGALVKLVPDSRETENPQASWGCQGQGSFPSLLLSVALFWAMQREAKPRSSLLRVASFRLSRQAGRSPRPGMGFTVSLKRIAGLTLSRRENESVDWFNRQGGN